MFAKHRLEQVKFLVIFRDPLSRAVSGFGHHMMQSTWLNTPAEFEKEISMIGGCRSLLSVDLDNCPTNAGRDRALEMSRCMNASSDYLRDELARGFYSNQLRQYLCAGFKPEQFLVLFTSELHNISNVVRTVSSFVRRPLTRQDELVLALIPPNLKKNHRSFNEEPSDEFQHRMIEFFKDTVMDLHSLLLSHHFRFDPLDFRKEFQRY